MEIKTLEIAGFEPAFKAMRLPMRSGDKSDSVAEQCDNNCRSCFHKVCEDDVVRTATPNFHIGSNDLKLSQKLIKAGPEHSKCMRGIMVWVEVTGPWYWFNEFDTYTIGRTSIGSTSSMHIDCKGLSGIELQAAKSNIRGDYEYTRICTINYQSLRNIYFQRRSHRLPEWRQFCSWTETLPLAKELITLE